MPLVREALAEREVLLGIAPHLVRALSFLIPIYRGGRRGRVMVRMGLVAYDALSAGKRLDGHRMLSRGEALGREPGLSAEGLRGAAVFYDAQVEYPERLAVENALAAVADGAQLQTYTDVEELVVVGGAVRGVWCRDLGSGERVVVRAPLVFNVTGPWVDRSLERWGVPSARLVGGTKGSHLVVSQFAGAPREALYVEAQADGRPYFIAPWNGRYLIGTTDTRFDGDPGLVAADDAEIAYLIDETNAVIPGARLTRADVLYSYAGVRPLPFRANGREGAISRRHQLHDHAPDGHEGLFSVVGGKITTYRRLAEQAVDLAVERLGRPAVRCSTGRSPLPGCPPGSFERFAEAFARDASPLDHTTCTRLVHTYGQRARLVLELVESDPDLARPLSDGGPLGAEIVHAFAHEHARTLTDVFLRRSMTGLDPSAGLDALEPALTLARTHLGWNTTRIQHERHTYHHALQRLRPRALDQPTITSPA